MSVSDLVGRLIDMPEAEYEARVSSAWKNRASTPEPWELVKRPELIDATREVVEKWLADAEDQALNPARYPSAAGFVRKMRDLLVDLDWADDLNTLRGEGG